MTGCSKVSPGCAHCYAETLSLRFGWSTRPWLPVYAPENVVLHRDRLDQPGRRHAEHRTRVRSLPRPSRPWSEVTRVPTRTRPGVKRRVCRSPKRSSDSQGRPWRAGSTRWGLAPATRGTPRPRTDSIDVGLLARCLLSSERRDQAGEILEQAARLVGLLEVRELDVLFGRECDPVRQVPVDHERGGLRPLAPSG